jgi:hypothetical protein
MPRNARRLGVFLALAALVAAACARDASQVVEVGSHRVRLVTPAGWEHLDHGRQQLFRRADAEIVLEDGGPVTPRGLSRALAAAETLWLAGRREDAVARVRELGGPALGFLSSDERGRFWRPWTDAHGVDDAALGAAIRDLIENAGALAAPPPDRVLEATRQRLDEDERREIDRQETRTRHGTSWTYVETWSRVSHMDRHRFACLDDDGYLLLAATRRGPIEVTGVAFDSLLASIQLLKHP